jgi:hypothetical protein
MERQSGKVIRCPQLVGVSAEEESPNVYVVANKLGFKDRRAIEDAQGRLYAEGRNTKFFTVSAIEGTEIRAMFAQIATELCGRRRISPILLGSEGRTSDCC